MFFQPVPGGSAGISRPFIVGLVMLLLFLSMQAGSQLLLSRALQGMSPVSLFSVRASIIPGSPDWCNGNYVDSWIMNRLHVPRYPQHLKVINSSVYLVHLVPESESCVFCILHRQSGHQIVGDRGADPSKTYLYRPQLLGRHGKP